MLSARCSWTYLMTVDGFKVKLLSKLAEPVRKSARWLSTTHEWPGLKIEVICLKESLEIISKDTFSAMSQEHSLSPWQWQIVCGGFVGNIVKFRKSLDFHLNAECCNFQFTWSLHHYKTIHPYCVGPTGFLRSLITQASVKTMTSFSLLFWPCTCNNLKW